MKLSDFQFSPSNHFVAMEYFWLILNRTFLILSTEKQLIGIKVHGMISVETTDPVVNLLPMTIDGNLQNPYSYIAANYIERIKDVDLNADDFLRMDKANFRIEKSDIVEVTYDEKKKWGMGYYPHDGKVYIRTMDKTREFIILGAQSGLEIRNSLTS